MKSSIIVLCGLLLSFGNASQYAWANESTNPLYDQARAMKTGADEYGMKRYVMAFLKRAGQPHECLLISHITESGI
ncbi:hypothetical protein [Shewanella saliphila]|uniref:Uncharacterized protein n=1 Tax=Shewanella saliphila TaxID=2282698 RepID=A0ABQ2QCI3_9GAMM|nr:hypothetical protein [Shewanella saliphila]MCL1103622.1 hypothetical protein [Shewanella saliphila]GGP71511.1 hypothetical protein GCM10009409_39470 [Shewanella saliphila]